MIVVNLLPYAKSVALGDYPASGLRGGSHGLVAVRVMVARVPVLSHILARNQPGSGSFCCISSHTGRAATSKDSPAAEVNSGLRDSSTVMFSTGALSA